MIVDEVISALARAWNDGDAEAYAALFTPDAGFVDVLGRLQQGRMVIAREHEGLFASIYRGSATSYKVVDERVVADRVVLAHTVGRLEVPTGPRAGVTHSSQTLLIEDGWIAAFHNVVQSDLLEFAGREGARRRTSVMTGIATRGSNLRRGLASGGFRRCAGTVMVLKPSSAEALDRLPQAQGVQRGSSR